MSDKNDKLLEVVTMPCPICGLVHGVEKHICTGVISIKGVRVEYPEEYFRCNNPDFSDDENIFESGEMLNNNLARARTQYKLRK